MSDPAFAISPHPPRASIQLDGANGPQQSSAEAVEISERGLRFTCPWSFTIGTQLSVAVTDMHPRLGLCQMHLEGIVVWCEPRGAQRHETTLLFLEFPDEIRPSLREFSHPRM
jgi:PilZ domain